ncbi:MAG: (2Fe-2S)-binding protein, partial [Bacteroidetes bacterium]|nr:(2Fe-2S)-binding protein [Bacteroidota bacterium]
MNLTIEVNNNIITANQGDTILDALSQNGMTVPTLCHMKGLFPTGACRMCVVEVEGRRNLVTACSEPVLDGMKIKTHSARVIESRKTIVELLLSNHPDDCLYCERNGSCELQDLSEDLHIRERRISGQKNKYKLDVSSASIVRDPAKCILCGRCVRVCEEIEGVSAIEFVGRGSKTFIDTSFNHGLNLSTCVNCGQCIMVCPTGALKEKDHISEIKDMLAEPEKTVVVQYAPSISVSLAEEFGLPSGQNMIGLMNAALRRMGFNYVFDTSFSADLTIMEEASELVHRVQNGGKLPMITSCCPGWVKYAEEFQHDMIENLSSCKSPQQMMGAIIKSYFAETENIAPENIYSVSIMPCTAKKFEQ